MFEVRQGLLDALGASVVERSVSRILDHARAFFPAQCQALGEEKARAFVRSGVDQAAVHGMVRERDVAHFVDLMFAFGPDFDQQPWARRSLDETAQDDPATRVRALHEAAVTRARRQGGEHGG